MSAIFKVRFQEVLSNIDDGSPKNKLDASLAASYDFFAEVAAASTISPLAAVRQEIAILEEQAQQLRATIERRRHVDVANASEDDSVSIMAHYQRVLHELQLRINELTLKRDSWMMSL